LDREVYALDPGLDPAYQHLTAQARLGSGFDEVIWLLNGEEIYRDPAKTRINSRLFPLTKGPQHLVVLGRQGGATVAKAQAR
jgi:hypothetical protein